MAMADPKKIIIDTDPGIDDAMAIFLALRSPEIKVIGLTTIYGNVYTTLATTNALHLLEVAGRTDIPVAEGSHVSYSVNLFAFLFYAHSTRKCPKVSCTCSLISFLGENNLWRLHTFLIFFFVQCQESDKASSSGLCPWGGWTWKPELSSAKVEADKKSAAEYLIEQANLYPGEVTVVALGPLTNIALAIQLEPAFTKRIGQIVLLGGAYAVNGSVNPAAETNIFGDPEAADVVFTSGADLLAIGMNVTRQVIMKDHDRDKLGQSDGMFGKYLYKILDHYFSYHRDAYSMKGIYLHDPTALLAAINPSLMTYTEGVVRVQTTGITRGMTLFFNKQKRFNKETEWCNKPTVKVAVTVDTPAVVKLVMERLMYS
ncbi:hypothetical protein OSB04_031122 [Centaurea solstitialis]|uniref:Inosine/uridine-preferring nucleoside hydrolase domain-containing protein n=1 Tax=Centaurea solstitialis TaxID=347529 RepID=A0AA38SA49_9ASTR|nr:hypothetical protein OSB04_031122 [Centaurea solstitialis]